MPVALIIITRYLFIVLHYNLTNNVIIIRRALTPNDWQSQFNSRQLDSRQLDSRQLDSRQLVSLTDRWTVGFTSKTCFSFLEPNHCNSCAPEQTVATTRKPGNEGRQWSSTNSRKTNSTIIDLAILIRKGYRRSMKWNLFYIYFFFGCLLLDWGIFQTFTDLNHTRLIKAMKGSRMGVIYLFRYRRSGSVVLTRRSPN